MKNAALFSLVLSTALFTLPVAAQDASAPSATTGVDRYNSAVDARQNRLTERYQRGVDSGSLTEHEQNQLKRKYERSERQQERATADGKVTRREARRMDRQLDRGAGALAAKNNNRRVDR